MSGLVALAIKYSMDSEESPLEYLLLRKPEVFVYKIPPRTAAGHRAETWQDSIWRGRLQVVGKGDTCTIKLLESETDELFAQSFVTKDIEASVEKALDSSRYFAVRLDDGHGRHAFVGLGFVDRNDAFDFICSLQDYLTRLESTGSTNDRAAAGDTGKFMLKEGEQLQIQIKNLPAKLRKSPGSGPSTEKQSPNMSSVPLLAPPPPAVDRTKQRKSVVSSRQRQRETDDLFQDKAFE